MTTIYFDSAIWINLRDKNYNQNFILELISAVKDGRINPVLSITHLYDFYNMGKSSKTRLAKLIDQVFGMENIIQI